MATPVTDLTQIEEAAEKFLKDQFTQIRKTAVQRDMRNIFATVALTVAIVRGRHEILGPRKVRTHVVLHALVLFSSAKSEEDRRKGINPLLMGITQKLYRQKLGLDIAGILPRGFQDETSTELWGENKIVYNLEFATYFEWAGDDPEADAPDLIGVAVDYFLDGRAAPAASDETII
ncbi:hypothetical protein L4X63_09275 [Geomonas sp. Red32]|uniref:hypothetical protein n=1 Tax=Geomonas sp. Red32 TaxID=2912856 RepID=UPI00202D0284|nr:hypothetical protein [Geomonas sp. Red32]MCM0081779.1 hypothetical protein [Geomonas sp. Red32]